MSVNWSTESVTGEFFAELDNHVPNPARPADWTPAVLSVVDTIHVVGSTVPAGHTRARTVDGDEPTACTLKLSFMSGVYSIPGTTISGTITDDERSIRKPT